MGYFLRDLRDICKLVRAVRMLIRDLANAKDEDDT
jgi:hypothetical protein